MDLTKRNNALNVNTNTQNGKTVDIGITTHGSDFYFAICAIMGVVGLGVIAASTMKPKTHRIFFYITAAINFTACIAYFAMGSNLGWAPIDVEYARSASTVRGTNRAIFYVRYIDWFVTTPLLLADLMLTAGLPWPTIVWTIFMDWVMIITGLVGALVKTSYKWGFYTFGCVAMFYVFFNLAWEGRRHAKHLGNDIYRTYTLCGLWTLFIWLLYPIAWGVSEGGNVIAPDSEAVFYGILDFCAKPIFSILLIAGHWNIDPARMGLSIRDYDANPREFPTREALEAEKRSHGNNGVHNGASTGVDAATANVARATNGTHTTNGTNGTNGTTTTV